ALAYQFFEDGDGHLEASLDFGRITVSTYKYAFIERCRNILANAIGPLLIGHGDSEALGLIFDLFLKYQLLQDLPGVEGLEGLHIGIALLDLAKLLAHVLHAN